MPGGGAGSRLDEEGRALVERLGGRWTAKGGMCRCPAHDDRSPSLSVRPGRTRLLLHCFAGCDAERVLRALAAGRLIEPGAPEPAGAPNPAPGGRVPGSSLDKTITAAAVPPTTTRTARTAETTNAGRVQSGRANSAHPIAVRF